MLYVITNFVCRKQGRNKAILHFTRLTGEKLSVLSCYLYNDFHVLHIFTAYKLWGFTVLPSICETIIQVIFQIIL